MIKGSIDSKIKVNDGFLYRFFFKLFLIIYIPMLLLSFVGGGGGNIYAIAAIAFVISLLTTTLRKNKMMNNAIIAFHKKVSEHLQEKFKTKFIYEDYYTLSGFPCCLAYDGKKIFIMNSGKYAILGWDDIRKWSYSIEGSVTTNVIGGNLGHQAQANLRDAEENRRLNDKSGFTIQVSDIENPSWFFPTGLGNRGKSICDKWMEIFNQINEGKLSIEK